MRHVLSFTGSAMLSAALAAPAGADQVFLKEAGVIAGRVISRTPASIEIEIGAGRVTIPADRVERVEEGRSLLDDYDDRLAALATRDRAGWLDLARWADSRGLASQAQDAYQHVLTIAPDDAEANRALGNVELDGRWVSESEGYRARGYVPFEGLWVTPDERREILEQREREDRKERRAADAARIHDAGVRACEAGARAAAQSAIPEDEYLQGFPLWWVWAPGPIVWPSDPMMAPTACRYPCR